MRRNAALMMAPVAAAAQLCTAVFDGDMPLLRRLLHAGANPNAADYDKRTALHIAAAEGNLPAVRGPVCVCGVPTPPGRPGGGHSLKCDPCLSIASQVEHSVNPCACPSPIGGGGGRDLRSCLPCHLVECIGLVHCALGLICGKHTDWVQNNLGCDQ